MQSKRGILPASSLMSSGTSDDSNDESPLRAFLHSMLAAKERKDDFFDIPADLFDISQSTPSTASQNTPSNYQMHQINDNQSPLSLTGKGNIAPGFFPSRKPDESVQIGNYEQKPLVQVQASQLDTLPGGLLAASIESKQKDNILSYDTLTELMEQTASTRCLLLQQTNENNTSSQPSMRSLSESAFKTILSSTKIKIKSINSIKSLGNTTEVQDVPPISERKNSTFDQITGYKNQQSPKKQRAKSMLDTKLLTLLRTSEETGDYCCKAGRKAKSPINSLPSCGSLEDSFSKAEKDLSEGTQNSSCSLPVYINVASCNRFMSLPSFDEEKRVPRVGKNQYFQTKRKFNSFQVTSGEDYRLSRHSCNGFNGGDSHRILPREGRNTSDKLSGKISQTMRHVLKRELERSASSM